ncbi:MAG: hypothetical protein Ta2E_03170 [Mycoplasmoidaceae bacterium]|nr:MAG: hypothetical protein Ta2E_03170 [Mycoplasmoidaceae bacterium]
MLVNVGFCFSIGKNKNYYKIVLSTITLMLSKTSDNNQYDIYILTDYDIDVASSTAAIKKAINKNNFNLKILKPNDELKHIDGHHWTIGTFYKFLFLELLPNSVKTMVYFDPDMYFNCDVAEFYIQPLENNHIGGWIDLSYKKWDKEYNVQYIPKNHRCYKELVQHFKTDTYLCAGCLLMNIELMRQDNIYQQLLDVHERNVNNGYVYSDQECFNAVCKKKVIKYYGMNLDWCGYWWKMNLAYFKDRKKFKIIHFHHPKFWSKKMWILYIINPNLIFFKKCIKEWNKYYKSLQV